MGRTILSRIAAAATAAYFLCAAIILPDLDALIFHGVEHQGNSQTHIETSGTPSCHAENCVLGAMATQIKHTGLLATKLARIAETASSPVHPAQLSLDNGPTGPSRSRAPPTVVHS